ncbi:MAG: hypothetical protein LBD15_01860 [Holosporales bacterium]|nr:hypothetical protein [Holosporales bacterium]
MTCENVMSMPPSEKSEENLGERHYPVPSFRVPILVNPSPPPHEQQPRNRFDGIYTVVKHRTARKWNEVQMSSVGEATPEEGLIDWSHYPFHDPRVLQEEVALLSAFQVVCASKPETNRRALVYQEARSAISRSSLISFIRFHSNGKINHHEVQLFSGRNAQPGPSPLDIFCIDRPPTSFGVDTCLEILFPNVMVCPCAYYLRPAPGQPPTPSMTSWIFQMYNSATGRWITFGEQRNEFTLLGKFYTVDADIYSFRMRFCPTNGPLAAVYKIEIFGNIRMTRFPETPETSLSHLGEEEFDPWGISEVE